MIKVYIYGADFSAVMNVIDDLTAELKNMSSPEDGILVPIPNDEVGFAEAFKKWMRGAKPGTETCSKIILNEMYRVSHLLVDQGQGDFVFGISTILHSHQRGRGQNGAEWSTQNLSHHNPVHVQLSHSV